MRRTFKYIRLHLAAVGQFGQSMESLTTPTHSLSPASSTTGDPEEFVLPDLSHTLHLDKYLEGIDGENAEMEFATNKLEGAPDAKQQPPPPPTPTSSPPPSLAPLTSSTAPFPLLRSLLQSKIVTFSRVTRCPTPQPSSSQLPPPPPPQPPQTPSQSQPPEPIVIVDVIPKSPEPEPRRSTRKTDPLRKVQKRKVGGSVTFGYRAKMVDGADANHSWRPVSLQFRSRPNYLRNFEILKLMSSGLGWIFATHSWSSYSYIRGWILEMLHYHQRYGRRMMTEEEENEMLVRIRLLRSESPECFPEANLGNAPPLVFENHADEKTWKEADRKIKTHHIWRDK